MEYSLAQIKSRAEDIRTVLGQLGVNLEGVWGTKEFWRDHVVNDIPIIYSAPHELTPMEYLQLVARFEDILNTRVSLFYLSTLMRNLDIKDKKSLKNYMTKI